ncbi:MAG: YHS domain-containing (seleno)protein [Pseudomonadota bacterium]
MKKMLGKNLLLTALLCLSSLALMSAPFTAALSESSAINLGYFNKLAVNGYDVMTIWRGGKPQEGDPGITFDYGGATWVFISQENRDAFAADPDAYAPQYGGYCAYAAAQGEVSDVDVFAWQIHKGKLYLNYSPRVQREWGSRIDENIEKADAIWPNPLQ